jgi:AraC-like DNA-binding protein
MNTIRLVFLIGAAQGFITFLVLFSYGKSHRKANYYLSFAVLILALNLASDYLFHGNEPFEFMTHGNFHALLGYACGPLIYLYVRHLTGFSSPRERIAVLCFLPFIISILFVIACSFPDMYVVLRQFYMIFEILSLVIVLVFIILSILRIGRYEHAIKNTFSNIGKLSIQWLQFILYSIGAILLIGMALYAWKKYFDLVWLLVTLQIYVMGYFTLRKPEILTGLVEESGSNKYIKSSLSPEMIRTNRMKIEKCMEGEKLFLDSEITLPMLAEKLSIPVHHLSQIINQEYNRNFYEFISGHRVEAAKEMMCAPEYAEMKIIDICYRVGFNSISAFNKSFKNYTGLTPTQYRKNGAC